MFLPPLDWHILPCVNHNLNRNVDLLLFAQPGLLFRKYKPATTAVLRHLVVEVSCRDGEGRVSSKGWSGGLEAMKGGDTGSPHSRMSSAWQLVLTFWHSFFQPDGRCHHCTAFL
jgi:hypothetical protein